MKTKDHQSTQPLEELIAEAFGRYAKYIIQERALPDLRDGLKPVQRRIIYSAYLNKLTSNVPHKKSATLVGEVMGSFHPHGDSSIYEAIVRLSQPWKLNLPLLEMHGNIGSIDGDPAAAYRYTEVRLAPVSDWLVSHIHKNTVVMTKNFDDTKNEPTILPAQFFNLLINGASGIAAGYATNIPPFNPVEVGQLLIQLIDQPNLSWAEITKILPAPDFPTGGVVEVNESLTQAYQTGNGRVWIAASYQIIKQHKINQIVFDSIPFEVNKANLVRSIDSLIANQTLTSALEVRDESDRNGISIVIDLEPQVDPEVIVQYLYQNTDLRISFPINLVAIDLKTPQLLNIKQLCEKYLVQFELITKKGWEYEQKKLQTRLEIIQGLILAAKMIDQILTIIRKATSKQQSIDQLVTLYNFTPLQAEAIVNLRLYKLNNTNHQALVLEVDQIQQQLSKINHLLTNEQAMKTHLKSLILAFIKQFGYPRKSQIQQVSQTNHINPQALVVNKPMCLSWITNNQLKLVEHKKYQLQDLTNNKIKPTDCYRDFLPVNYQDQLLIITNFGNYTTIYAHQLEVKKLNVLSPNTNNSLNLALSEQIVGVFVINQQLKPTTTCLVLTKFGLTKQVVVHELINKKGNKLANIIKLQPDDQVIKTLWIDQPNSSLLYASAHAYCNHILTTSINTLSKNAAGHKPMRLKNGDYCVDVLLVPNNTDSKLIVWTNQGVYKTSFNNKQALSKLAAVGKRYWPKKVTNLIKCFFVSEADHLWIKDLNNEYQLVSVSSLKLDQLIERPISDLYLETWTAKPRNFQQNQQEEVSQLF